MRTSRISMVGVNGKNWVRWIDPIVTPTPYRAPSRCSTTPLSAPQGKAPIRMTRTSASPPKIPAPQRTRRSADQTASRKRKTVGTEIAGDSIEYHGDVKNRTLAKGIVRGSDEAVERGHGREERERRGRGKGGGGVGERR